MAPASNTIVARIATSSMPSARIIPNSRIRSYTAISMVLEMPTEAIRKIRNSSTPLLDCLDSTSAR
jgi:hypothetical protein